jgi:hypothetical protein
MLINNPVITGSFTVNGTNFITNTPTTGSNTFNGNQIISGSAIVTGSLQVTGSITTTGTITAQTLVVQTVTSSVVYSSGSNVFGNSLSNTQQMTGSVSITGSLNVVTAGTELQVGATGVTLGNALTDIHNATGSLRVTGSLAVGSGSFPQTFAVKISGSTYNGTNVWFQDGSATDGMSFGGNGANSFKTINTYGGALHLNNISQNGVNMFGNVGIGTSSPSKLLDMVGDTFAGIGINDGTNTAVMQWHVSDGFRIVTATAKPLVFFTNNVERMRVTSGGYTKMTNNGVISYPNGTIHELRQTAADYVYYTINANATPYGAFFDYTTAAPNGTGNSYIVCADTSVTRFAVRSNGGVYNYSANNVNLSDISTKKDIIPCESYWDKFKAIEIVKFKYKDQSHDDYNIGVIAQQIEEVAPEFIDTDDWSKPDEEEKILKAVYTEDLHHATIKVLQEAMARIEQLEAEIEILKNK